MCACVSTVCTWYKVTHLNYSKTENARCKISSENKSVFRRRSKVYWKKHCKCCLNMTIIQCLIKQIILPYIEKRPNLSGLVEWNLSLSSPNTDHTFTGRPLLLLTNEDLVTPGNKQSTFTNSLLKEQIGVEHLLSLESNHFRRRRFIQRENLIRKIKRLEVTIFGLSGTKWIL